ncbi:MAG: 4Fe-4S binding protein [Chloroflexi bacterium]|nr:4Fe-4S binding protein [Chloroflexota bacterium]
MSMYPDVYHRLFPHWAKRFVFFLLGIVLLYSPFALLTKLVLFLANKPFVGDVHSICLRMPIQWLVQPWMYRTILSDPTYMVSVVFLPIAALFLGPLFCGWVCPAGQITEFLSRLVPPRFQIDLSGKVNGVSVRYGFMLGMMGITFLGGNACCSFCNFTHAQNMLNALFGDFLGISYLASFSIVSFVLWFFVMGLFTRGGRGWCNFLCPAGALMGLAHYLGTKLKIGRLVNINRVTCTNCKTCTANCPAWAMSYENEKPVEINYHACTACMDCARVCPAKAISYKWATREQA